VAVAVVAVGGLVVLADVNLSSPCCGLRAHRCTTAHDAAEHASQTARRRAVSSASALLARRAAVVLLSAAQEGARQLSHQIAAAATAAAAVALLSSAKQRASELADEILRTAAVAAALLVVAHKRVHREALSVLSAHACLIDAQRSHTPSDRSDSPGPPTPLVPSPVSAPCAPSGLLYGFVFCAGVPWVEPPMGASLVGRSHCETPVLIWTSGVGQYREVLRWSGFYVKRGVEATHSSICECYTVLAVSQGVRRQGGAGHASRGVAWRDRLTSCPIAQSSRRAAWVAWDR
jgi:hypothetical protein